MFARATLITEATDAGKNRRLQVEGQRCALLRARPIYYSGSQYRDRDCYYYSLKVNTDTNNNTLKPLNIKPILNTNYIF